MLETSHKITVNEAEKNNIRFDWDDITIIPHIVTDIKSRKEVNPYTELDTLPLITAPMDSLFSLKDKISKTKTFNKDFVLQLQNNGIKTCTVRGYKKSFSHIPNFESYSLNDIKDFIENPKDSEIYTDKSISTGVLIDIANGHMKEVIQVSKEFKEKYPDIDLIVGYIANPKTYKLFAGIGVDYIRVGIGNGSGCLTSQQTAISYPMASLIKEVHDIKTENGYHTKIVADGGFRKYSDIIKALVLGADYVMLGSLFSKTLESDNYPYLYKKFKIKNRCLAKWLFKNNFPLYKKFKGMSTKEAQKILGTKRLKTSEGVIRWYKVEYTLNGWLDNFESYLRSAMSYTNSTTLEHLKEAEYVMITENAHNRFKK